MVAGYQDVVRFPRQATLGHLGGRLASVAMQTAASSPDHPGASVRGCDDLRGRTRALVERYLDGVVADDPVEATLLGDHSRDGDLPHLTVAALDARARHLDALHAAAVSLHTEAVTHPEPGAREAAGDLRLLMDTLDAKRFHLVDRPRFATDPLAVLDLVAAGVWELLRRDAWAPAPHRCRAAIARARDVPRLLEQAGRLLEAIPRPHLAVALGRLDGLRVLVRETLPRAASGAGMLVGDAEEAGRVAADGLDAFGALLHELCDEPPADWRFGPAHHRRVLRTSLGSELTGDAIAARAQAALADARADLDELSGRVWASWFTGEPCPHDSGERARRVLEAIADDRVTRAGFVTEAGRALEQARAFCRDTRLVSVPETPCELREVPRFQQGLYPAYAHAAPPLEPDAGATVYVSPVPADWGEVRTTSFLREYNRTVLRSLAVHEGYPGHVVQQAHAGRHPRLARRLLQNPAFAEGWAVYAEQLVVDHGFGDDAYRITQCTMRLRVAANALLDIGMHAGDLDDARATELLATQAFQQEAEVRGKLLRAQVTAGQLSAYFVGGSQVRSLRDEVVAARGDAFDEAAFHRELLAHGTPPVSVVRAALLAGAPSGEGARPFDGGGTPTGTD